ncbi:hypothetical protein V8G54_008187 [Vigna mungo]|uniref:O-methyltransferase C-terminal domain-containing protein n=1 Tax=Vigna mungo TaxID=3915 RepID=A0AAQ3P396_VIGMU
MKEKNQPHSLRFDNKRIVQWILHDWSDEHCVKLLKNCYDGIPDDGKVIVMEAVLPTTPETNSAVYKAILELDVAMMTQNPGGKERCEQEFMDLQLQLDLVALDMNVVQTFSQLWSSSSKPHHLFAFMHFESTEQPHAVCNVLCYVDSFRLIKSNQILTYLI